MLLKIKNVVAANKLCLFRFWHCNFCIFGELFPRLLSPSLVILLNLSLPKLSKTFSGCAAIALFQNFNLPELMRNLSQAVWQLHISKYLIFFEPFVKVLWWLCENRTSNISICRTCQKNSYYPPCDNNFSQILACPNYSENYYSQCGDCTFLKFRPGQIFVGFFHCPRAKSIFKNFGMPTFLKRCHRIQLFLESLSTDGQLKVFFLNLT